MSETSKNVKYHISGIDCPSCADKIQKKLETIEDVTFAKINFSTSTLSINSNNLKKINEAVQEIEPSALVKKATKDIVYEEDANNNSLKIRIFLSLSFFLFGILMELFQNNNQYDEISLLFLATSYLIAGYDVVLHSFKGIKRLAFTDEKFLMTIATFGAILIGEISEATAVMVFYMIGQFFEQKAVHKSRNSINSLLKLRPDTAHLVVGSDIITVSAEDIKIEDKIIVKPGERIPLDGEIIQGTTQIDLSAITGESKPVSVTINDNVLSGSINKNNVITIKVLKNFEQSTMSKILDAVENATNRKAKTEQLISRFSKYYTPFIIILALSIATLPMFLFNNQDSSVWIYRALVILVISCPCAIVISIPLSYFAGLGLSSHRGILLKGADVIDNLSNASAIYLDKTGTLTQGKFKISEIFVDSNYSEEEVLYYAAIAEFHSTHPIATSIKEENKRSIDPSIIINHEEFPALGIITNTKIGKIMVGNDKFIHKHNIPHKFCIEDCTAVYCIYNDKYIGHILIEDKIKDDSKATIRELRNLGIDQISLLTGDTKEIAERVALQVGINIENVYSSLLPLNKLEIVEKHIMLNQEKNSNKKVIFVGDGINDAPVIKRADVGIAMGSIGSDAAIEASDVVIMNDQPMKIIESIKIAQKTYNKVKQNLVLAISIKIIFITFGIFGLASMWVAVFGDVGVTLLTIFNSIILLRDKNTKNLLE